MYHIRLQVCKSASRLQLTQKCFYDTRNTTSEGKRDKMTTYPEPMITTNNPDAKNVLIVIQKLQSLSAGCCWKPRFNIHFPKTPDAKVPLHDAPANKRLVLLRLIESPDQ